MIDNLGAALTLGVLKGHADAFRSGKGVSCIRHEVKAFAFRFCFFVAERRNDILFNRVVTRPGFMESIWK